MVRYSGKKAPLEKEMETLGGGGGVLSGSWSRRFFFDKSSKAAKKSIPAVKELKEGNADPRLRGVAPKAKSRSSASEREKKTILPPRGKPMWNSACRPEEIGKERKCSYISAAKKRGRR